MEHGRNRLIVASALVVMLLGALALWRTGRGGERAFSPVVPAAEAPDVPELTDPGVAELEPAKAAATESTRVAPVRPEAHAPAAAPSHSTLAEIRGRLVFADGSPAAKVPWRVRGWGAGQERELLHPTPGDWQDPSGATDRDGRFSARFDPPHAFQFLLEASLADFAELRWRWDEITPGTVVDVGDAVLAVGGTLEGRIVDARGNALRGEWSVHASTGLAQARADVEQGTARYRVEHVPAGRVALKAHSEIAGWIGCPAVTLADGETRTVDIVYDGPDNSRRITVTIQTRTFHVMDMAGPPDPEHIRLHGPGVEVRTARPHPGSFGSHVFDDLPEGVYTALIDDPRYLPWTSANLRPGRSVNAKLEGSSALALRVLDEQGQPLEDFELRVEFRNVDFSPREFVVGHEDGRVRGMFAGDYTVRVAAGERLGAIDVDGLLPGETRTLTVRLGESCTLSGRVVHRDGTPVAGVEVSLLQPAEVDDSALSPILPSGSRSSVDERIRKQVDSVASDASGCFRFAIARAGKYVAHATQNGSSVSSEVLQLSGAGREGLELVLARGGRLRGRLVGAGDASWERFLVGLRAEIDPAIPPMARMQRNRQAADSIRPVGADGRFELGPLPAGAGTVQLHLPDMPSSRTGSSYSSGSGLELGTVTLEEDKVLERDFDVFSLPGTLALDVTVNGAPAAGLRVQLSSPTGNLSGETDAQGTFGPRAAFAATWKVQIDDPEFGWRHAAPALESRPASDTRVAVAIDVAEARLVLVDASSGEPLVGRSVGVFLERRPLGAFQETDAAGGASFTLTPGEYKLVLDPPERPWNLEGASVRSAVLTWTVTGPLAERVSL
jgi:hypothetical protein